MFLPFTLRSQAEAPQDQALICTELFPICAGIWRKTIMTSLNSNRKDIFVALCPWILRLFPYNLMTSQLVYVRNRHKWVVTYPRPNCHEHAQKGTLIFVVVVYLQLLALLYKLVLNVIHHMLSFGHHPPLNLFGYVISYDTRYWLESTTGDWLSEVCMSGQKCG